MAPESKVRRLVTKKLTVNRTVLKSLAQSELISEKKLTQVALRVMKDYRTRYEDAQDEGLSNKDAFDEAVNGEKLMINRVHNSIIYEITRDIKHAYRGEEYEWLPSDALEPDPLHQLNYGKTFKIGRGEMPGDRIGCKCGMNILVKQDKLEL